MSTKWLAIAAINGFIAVAAGAFGAHALKGTLDADAMNAYDVGVRYQMYHALALLAVAWSCHVRSSRWVHGAGVCMLAGIVLFSGSLYGLALLKWRWLGPITPIGGVFFLVGWLFLAIGAWRRNNREGEAPAEPIQYLADGEDGSPGRLRPKREQSGPSQQRRTQPAEPS